MNEKKKLVGSMADTFDIPENRHQQGSRTATFKVATSRTLRTVLTQLFLTQSHKRNISWKIKVFNIRGVNTNPKIENRKLDLKWTLINLTCRVPLSAPSLYLFKE